MPAYEKHRGGPFVIYLAGGTSPWREQVRQLTADYDVSLIDPFEDSEQRACMEFVAQDLEYVRQSDVVLAYHDYDPVYGLVMEATHAFNHHVPVYYVLSEVRRPIIVVCAISRAIFTDLNMATRHILDRHEVRTKRG